MLTSELFDLTKVGEPIASLLDVPRPWQALARLDAFGAGLLDDRRGRVHPTAIITGPLVMEEGAEVGPYAYLDGPVYMCAGAVVGHTAYLRGPVVLGPGAKVLHASEVKRSIFLAGAKAPHFNYIGDSVVGAGVNFGAGVKIANFKVYGDEVKVGSEGTGMRKLGCIAGDGVSVGCNAVLAPGTVIGRDSIVYHGAALRGIVPPGSVVKLRQQLEQVELRASGSDKTS
ncbi:MAG: hypothetical protein KF813_01090 [Trueperaceae bacterium]|nr:hypothetical protein [Trueperaceae bacterium]